MEITQKEFIEFSSKCLLKGGNQCMGGQWPCQSTFCLLLRGRIDSIKILTFNDH